MDIYSLLEIGDKGEVVSIDPLEIIEIQSLEQLAELLDRPVTEFATRIEEAAK